ncbi:uncharacterized protein LOC129988251 isoform X2 [Argiope bruennichi]|uniref:uncharacterized protein LOC129988251 isoform X2 n=1 Tax=Argiope bruennichi TaxID=94029 RepID=UPI002495A61D|nr:uncharacterized protein LOC129988251 isoform X2 [Argiope bruennichi]
MANDIASLFPKMDRNELIYAEFIKDKIQKNGGSLKFQHISGQLSQLEHNVRSAIGAGSKELMNFLKKYNDLFIVDDGLVSLKSSSGEKEASATPKNINVNGKSEKESVFPKVLNDVPGIVIKVQPTFGFIAIKEPKASVYFTPSCFNNANKTLLPDLGIVPGKKVCLNAKIGNLDFESKYKATKVWIPANVENEVLHPEGFLPKVPKTRETGLYDADTSEGSGTIQKVFDSFGFIIIDGDKNNTVFFHKNNVCNVENLQDLTKVFHPGDLVEYKAIRSKKPNNKVRWEATKVWIRKKSKNKSKEKGESATSDYESIGSQSKNSKLQKSSDFKKTENKSESKEISNEIGKIYPSAKGTVIKFGEKDSKLADADSCLFYLHKVQVEDVSWEFSDGDSIRFDGIKIKSPPGYKALLAWVGDKPDVVPIALGDFPEHTDEDIEDASENESCISKTSSTSALSETYLNLSKTKAQKVYSSTSSLISNSSKKSRNRSRSKVNEIERHSNYNGDDSHSISSNSRSSQYSGSNGRQRRSKSRNSRVDEMKRFPSYTEEDSYSASSNSRSSHHSAFNENRQRRSKSRNSQLKKNYKSNSVDSSHSQLTNCRSKASSRESVNSLSSDVKIKLKPNPDLFKNWGDTPYPDDNDEVSKIYLKAHGREGIQRKNSNYSSGNISSGKSSPCSDEIDQEIENTADNLVADDFPIKTDLNVNDKVSNNCDKVKSSFSSRYAAEIFLSDEDFSDALEEVNEDTLETAANDLNEEADTETQEEKPKSYIKRFQDLEGHVKKVFCRYAEIENERLRKPGTFFWNEMYHNGVPVPDKFDDLKEVVSHGQTVKFNCFEIVDDVGNYFLKVTVAWKGSKPEITEETPEEYIIKNNICFSGKEISTSEDLVDRNCSESMRPLNVESAFTTTSTAPRKFLTVASMSDDNDSDEEKDQSDPSENSQGITLKEDSDSNLNTQEYVSLRENILSSSKNMDIPQLTDAISRMLENFKNSQIDSSTVASELVNMVLNTVGPGNTLSSQANAVPSFESTETTRRTEMTDSSAQTIITGKIFSENSFFPCRQ